MAQPHSPRPTDAISVASSKDAFHTLRVLRSERRYQAVCVEGAYHVYDTVVSGGGRLQQRLCFLGGPCAV
eukprot:517960-Amphidinium_carterae.1